MEDQDPPLNPSQQVERIREILVGRQMNQVEDRLRRLEDSSSGSGPAIAPEVVQRVKSSQVAVIEETQELRRLLREQSESTQARLDQIDARLESTREQSHRHEQQLLKNLRVHLENVSSAMAARIDARVREVLHHLQKDLVQWKNQIDRDLQTVRDESVDRTELKTRLARMATAAMEDDPANDDGEGFLL